MLQCDLDPIFNQERLRGRAREFFRTELRAVRFLLEESYVSIVGTLVFLGLAIYFVPTKLERKRRIALGITHFLSHLLAAFALMLMLEVGVEVCVRHELLGTSGYHTLYEWYQSKQKEHFPDPTRLRSRMEVWTFGLYPACFKYLMSAFDVPETMAVTRNKICKEGMQKLPRRFQVLYYVCVFLYYWVLSTPVVSLVMGCYLYICINWLHVHFDEAFSSLRIAHFKSFIRGHITPDGHLEIFVLAVDKVPRDWSIDPKWFEEQESSPGVMPHKLSYPSKWIPAPGYCNGDSQCNVRIVDHFVVDKKPLPCPKPASPPQAAKEVPAGTVSSSTTARRAPKRTHRPSPLSGKQHEEHSPNRTGEDALGVSISGGKKARTSLSVADNLHPESGGGSFHAVSVAIREPVRFPEWIWRAVHPDPIEGWKFVGQPRSPSPPRRHVSRKGPPITRHLSLSPCRRGARAMGGDVVELVHAAQGHEESHIDDKGQPAATNRELRAHRGSFYSLPSSQSQSISSGFLDLPHHWQGTEGVLVPCCQGGERCSQLLQEVSTNSCASGKERERCTRLSQEVSTNSCAGGMERGKKRTLGTGEDVGYEPNTALEEVVREMGQEEGEGRVRYFQEARL
ncbi:hypothetical protein CBR_g765 [Chara braunii]|uniref:Uncharacterized protein n=1 Tax=Chara braunii TaxID=69332 RepID=A0A388KCA5_CHABU|nr:hypothetical protein CBR_g765 [Chara braunii]|eukprot:GBG67636.1 hypothetical protein CBR_g765 [Chara braunii]